MELTKFYLRKITHIGIGSVILWTNPPYIYIFLFSAFSILCMPLCYLNYIFKHEGDVIDIGMLLYVIIINVHSQLPNQLVLGYLIFPDPIAALVERTYQLITNSRVQKSYIGFTAYFTTSVLWSLFIHHALFESFYISFVLAVINIIDYDNLYVLFAYYFFFPNGLYIDH